MRRADAATMRRLRRVTSMKQNKTYSIAPLTTAKQRTSSSADKHCTLQDTGPLLFKSHLIVQHNFHVKAFISD